MFVAGVIPTQKEKTQEAEKLYRLWFILDSNGSVYSAFCRCKGGADQGCRHLGATLFELDDFLSNQRKSVTSMSAYWNPKPTPKQKPVPISEVKISFSNLRKKKRKVTPSDDSWIDSFDPRPMKQRRETTFKDKLVRKIDPCFRILDFLPPSKDLNNEHNAQQPENNISHLYVLSQAKMYVKANLDKLSEDNLSNCAEEFLQTLTFSDNDRMNIKKATVGQHKNKTWHKMRHLLVTGKKIKSLYTRQKTLKLLSCYLVLVGKKDKDGKYFLDENHLHYFQVQTGMAVSGLKTCDFVTYTSKGIFVVKINFNANSWETVVATFNKFYCNQMVPSFLLEAFHSISNHTQQ